MDELPLFEKSLGLLLIFPQKLSEISLANHKRASMPAVTLKTLGQLKPDLSVSELYIDTITNNISTLYVP